MEPYRRQHIVLALVLGAMGFFLAKWGCPYIHVFHHEGLCVVLYVILVLIFIYARAEGRRRRRITRPHA
jgi:membrane protein DedA with SNARE-associated domain